MYLSTLQKKGKKKKNGICMRAVCVKLQVEPSYSSTSVWCQKRVVIIFLTLYVLSNFVCICTQYIVGLVDHLS